MAFVDARDRRHDLPGRAVAALEGILIDEGLLHRMQLAVCARPSIVVMLRPCAADRERQAGQYAAAIEQHRAGAALPVVATFLRSGEAEVLAQRVEQRAFEIECVPVFVAIDLERDIG